MLIEKPIAFESLDFLPGFPTLSKFACNPWSSNFKAGACANPPVAIGRERGPLNGWPAVQAAIRAAGGTVPSVTGLGGGGRGGDRHIQRLRLSGAGGHADRHRADYGYQAGTLRNDVPGYRAKLGGCGCGGSCGCGGGAGLGFDASSVTSWVTANWMPLAIGAAAVWFLKRR